MDNAVIVGADTGGTFTDVVTSAGAVRKVLSTPEDPAQALANLRVVLEREPTNETARRLLDKVERESRAEAGFRREVTPRFVVKYRDTLDAEARRAIVWHLEAAAARIGRTLAYAPPERTTVVLYEYH